MQPYYVQKGNIFGLPIIHYTMEMAAQVLLAIEKLRPDAIAVELPEPMALQCMHAASRLPDISVIAGFKHDSSPIYYMAEPCDPAFEGLRSAMEQKIPAFCIDLDVDAYPNFQDLLPDPYAIQKIGLEAYYDLYRKASAHRPVAKSLQDRQRELYMSKRLKELSFSYERILFIVGMVHLESIFAHVDDSSFPPLQHVTRDYVKLCTLTDASQREVLSESGWMSARYEEVRSRYLSGHTTPDIGEERFESFFPPDRHKLIYTLCREAARAYTRNTGHPFPGYNMRNLMKFMRNYAVFSKRLMPDFFQILSAAKGCVDHNYAYEVWELATNYPYLRNIDNLEVLNLSVEDVWGVSKRVRFHLKHRGRKEFGFNAKRADRKNIKFTPPGPFSICSYPKEDVIVENFGDFLRKKGTQLFADEGAKTIPFTTTIEDGIDIRETIRHWYERKLYIKSRGRPPAGVGSVVVIFNEDSAENNEAYAEKYPWKTTWLGEHIQESDMAFYATPMSGNVVGPGISRCEYGGFMMSFPPRRMRDVWTDPDYTEYRSKAEVLLTAAIDYSLQPLIVYVGAKPPRTAMKSFARCFGKKIVFIPFGQLSPSTLNKLRIFHVLDGFQKRSIADEYIF
jgi:hypothetical protein